MKEEYEIDLFTEKKSFLNFLSKMEDTYKNIGRDEERMGQIEVKILNQFEKMISIIKPLRIDNHNLEGKISVLENEIDSLKKSLYELQCELDSYQS